MGKPQFVLQYAQRVLLAFFPVGGVWAQAANTLATYLNQYHATGRRRSRILLSCWIS